MADEHINIKINAKDEASPTLDRVQKKIRGFNSGVSFISSTMETIGKVGRWAGGIFFGVGLAVDFLSKKYQQMVIWANKQRNQDLVARLKATQDEAKAAAEAVDLLTESLKKQNAVLRDRAQYWGKFYNAQAASRGTAMNLDQQIAISKLNPHAKDYDEKKAQIEDEYAKRRINHEFEARKKLNDLEIARLRAEVKNAEASFAKAHAQSEIAYERRSAAYSDLHLARVRSKRGDIEEEDLKKIEDSYKAIDAETMRISDKADQQRDAVKAAKTALQRALSLESRGYSEREAKLLAIDNAAARRKAVAEQAQQREKAIVEETQKREKAVAEQAQQREKERAKEAEARAHEKKVRELEVKNAKELSHLTAQANMGIKASDRIASMGGFATKGIAAVAGAAIKLDPKVMQLRNIQRILSSQKSTLEDIKQAIEDSESISQFGR